jgi:nucleotide-binding universal stress UspA family protein
VASSDEEDEAMYDNVIWATDGLPASDVALREARALTAPDGRIVAVHCDRRVSSRGGSWPAYSDEPAREANVRRAVDALRDDGVRATVIVRRTYGDAADVVARVADEVGADAIVCGTRRRSAFAAALLGSFSHRLLHVAHCPVVAVPDAGPATAEPRG